MRANTMWCRLSSPLVLLPVLVLVLVLLSISEAETLSEFDRCVLGDCGPLTAAGGATAATSEDAGGRDKDGASVAALKRSPQDASAGVTEQAEGSGEGDSAIGGENDNSVAESQQSTNSAAEEEVTTSSTSTDGTEDIVPSPSSSPPAPAATTDQPANPPSGQRGADELIEPTEFSETAGDSGAERTDDPEAGTAPDGLDWRTDHCPCDLAVSDCDPDCCCDPDCSAEDRGAFSGCRTRPSLTPDPRYCLQSDRIFSNNTELRMERTEGGLFCIVRDNFVSRNTFPVVQVGLHKHLRLGISSDFLKAALVLIWNSGSVAVFSSLQHKLDFGIAALHVMLFTTVVTKIHKFDRFQRSDGGQSVLSSCDF